MGIKIKIDLDANTDKLAAAIQQGVARGFQGAGTAGLATNPAEVVRQIMGTQGAGMRGYKDTMGATVLPAQHDFTGGRGNAFLWSKIVPPRIADVMAKTQAQQAQFLKNIGFAGIPLLSPGSVLGNLFASRQIFSGLSGSVGQALLGKVGVGGTLGTAAATGGIMAILLAVGASLKALQAAIKGTIAAFDEARRLYAKSLLSGLGIQFTAGRGNIADVLGVNEKEVMQFGAAIGILGPKLKFATDIMARTTPNLTSVAWEFGILKKNLEALFFTIANEAAPAIRVMTNVFSQLVKVATVLSTIFANMVKDIGHLIMSALKGITAGTGLPELIKAAIKSLDMGAAPNPQGMMKQVPVSALERAGLVIGGFNPMNDAGQRTAKATEKTAKLLEKLVNSTMQGGASFADPFFNSP